MQYSRFGHRIHVGTSCKKHFKDIKATLHSLPISSGTLMNLVGTSSEAAVMPLSVNHSSSAPSCFGPPSNPFSIMEQKSSECRNMLPYLLRRREHLNAKKTSRIPRSINHSCAKKIQVSARRDQMLKYREIFGVFILQGGKQQGKIQVPAKERRGCNVGKTR